MYSVTGDTTSLAPGFPIRTSSDPRSVDSSPRHNAASHVLHRLSVPRHPPCALKHLQHKTEKYSRKNKKLHYQNKQPPKGSHLFRCSQPLSTNQTPHPTTKDRATPDPPPHTVARETTGLLPQSPIVCLMIPQSSVPTPLLTFVVHPPETHYRPGTDLPTALIPHTWGRGNNKWCSLERR